eukprot:TRINITY_DN32064_c0_g1_i1.p1 TRINITY_DN32064_c0_g1~~TRINITY_DN32064_c0_g1_i1.p1  ORF type:complete len:103 (-),score=10.33 TRINITY_DN32064_c0_g1_i1:301-609(-)
MLIARAEVTEIEDITVRLYLRGLGQSIWLELAFQSFATETVAYQHALKVDEIIKKIGSTKVTEEHTTARLRLQNTLRRVWGLKTNCETRRSTVCYCCHRQGQ